MSILDKIKDLLIKDEEFYGSMDNVEASIKARYAEQILKIIKRLETEED